jgi:PAS domain S-box-containing protein
MPAEQRATKATKARRVYWPVIVCLAGGAGISLALFITARTWEEQQSEAEFTQAARDRVATLEREFIYNLKEIEHVVAFFAGSEFVTRAEFHGFIGRVRRGLVGDWTIQWVPCVRQSEQAAFEQQAQQEGLEGFALTERDAVGRRVPVSPRPEYYPVLYSEPPDGRAGWLGLDLGSQPATLATLLRARDSGADAVSQLLEGNPGADQGGGIRVVLAVYRLGMANSPEDRQANLEGFIVGWVAMGDFLSRAVGPPLRSGLVITVTERAGRHGERLVWASSQPAGSPSGPVRTTSDAVPDHLSYSEAFAVGGSRWQIRCAASPGYRARSASWNDWAVLILGLVLTVAVASHLRGSGVHAQGLIALNERLTREIENRARVETALREATGQVTGILDSISDGFFVLDEQFVVTYFNKAAERLLNRKAEEVLGRNLFDAFPEARGSIFEEKYGKAMRDKTATAFEFYFDREPYANWYDVRVYPLEQGVSIYFQVTTERRRAERELAEAQAFLLAERTQELEESRVRLAQSERLASIGTLAAGIAHEINNPVGTMMLAAENALELRRLPGTEAMVEDCLRGVIAEARRCGDVIKSVLQFARHERTRKWRNDINTVLCRSLELAGQYAQEHGAVVKTEPGRDVAEVMINPLQIGQVFVNLIRNAIEAGPRGVQITIRTGMGAGTVRITVQDDGPGIPAEHIEHVFDPFFTTRRERGGTGLGLSIVHGIIAEHGGAISVQSRPGSGTVFVIDLPPAPDERTEGPHAEDTHC